MARMRRRAFLKTALVVAGVLVGGTVGYMVIEGYGPFDALYMTTITVTTIGFREVFPLSPAGRLFTIFLAFTGVGVILLVATELGRAIVEVNLSRMIGLRRELKMIRRMSNHIVVCGYGRMGRAVVEVLRARHMPFVVVETSPGGCAELEEAGVHVVQGDATREDALNAARVSCAKTFLACLSDDAHNVFAILLARQLNPGINIIARAVEEGSEERLRLAGANQVINPYRLGGMRLAFTAIKPTVVDFIEASLPGSPVELELAEIVVQEDSDLAGKTLASAEVRKRFGLIVVALKRGDRSTFNPGPDEQIHAGDVLVALGSLQSIERLEKATQS